jgi:hypothetical protein
MNSAGPESGPWPRYAGPAQWGKAGQLNCASGTAWARSPRCVLTQGGEVARVLPTLWRSVGGEVGPTSTREYSGRHRARWRGKAVTQAAAHRGGGERW